MEQLQLNIKWKDIDCGAKPILDNPDDCEIIYEAEKILLTDEKITCLVVRFDGQILKNSGGCLYVNGYPIPLSGIVSMEIKAPTQLAFTLKVPAQSALRIDNIEAYCKYEMQSLYFECDNESDVLVVCPDYPSTDNLYLCAFVHSRVREYINQGLKVQVAVIGSNWYEKQYVFENVSVYCGHYKALKYLLSKKQYKVIVTHFVDTPLFQIYDGYITNEHLIFICHGPETTFRHLNNVCRPYFTAPIKHEDISEDFDVKESYIRKYSQKDNVDWVFVSKWFYEFSRKCCECDFKHYLIINNLIDESIFPYRRKTAEDRKKIIILRKFDNISVHAIDQCVYTVLELSRRPFFKDLNISFYGDGSYWKELIGPLEQFDNVNIHKTFVPNSDIKELYKDNGILLIPSRHDAHPVSMSEGAASGLVVVASDVTSVSDFMNKEENNTLAEPENFKQLADIIERLYYNPEEYLAISERMAKSINQRCSKNETVNKEIQLIKDKKIVVEDGLRYSFPDKNVNTVLTIVVPAYNVEQYLDKCLFSLCNHRNAGKTEIIVVNDGSQDKTSQIAHYYESITNGIVKVIDKENGGHGSTINTGIKSATGQYFRLIDGDDWVDSENLALLVDVLEHETADIVLTKGCYEYLDQDKLMNIIDYPMLREGVHYHFDDLLYPYYGFDTYGPLLTTGNYKTECLQRANIEIAEKRPYVDMEFNAFAQRYTDTVVFYDLDIYRYLIGRSGQTVSKEFWKKKYNDHRFVIFDILNKLDSFSDYSQWRRREYVYKHLLSMMIDSQIFMYDQLCMWEEIDCLFDELGEWEGIVDISKEYITKKAGDCDYILKHYRRAINEKRNKPLIGERGERTNSTSMKRKIKNAVKAVLPYGAVRLYQKKFRNN